MDFQTVVSAIRRRWWVLAITALVGIFFGNLVSTHEVREYTATTRLFVAATGGGNSSSEAYSGGQFSEQRVQSYAQMISGQQLTRRVVDRLHLPLSADELSSKVHAAIVPRTVLLDLSATDPSPERATEIANTLADESSSSTPVRWRRRSARARRARRSRWSTAPRYLRHRVLRMSSRTLCTGVSAA